jgi:hypothetical protein
LSDRRPRKHSGNHVPLVARNVIVAGDSGVGEISLLPDGLVTGSDLPRRFVQADLIAYSRLPEHVSASRPADIVKLHASS